MTAPHHSPDTNADNRIAIVGIGCRFPGGVRDARDFWRNLVAGKDCITATPPDRYDVATLISRHKDKPGRLVGGRGGYIEGFDEFDPAFFGISPREAEHMDPQQRKLLEVAWEALEDGGQHPVELAGGRIGVYIGAFTLDWKAVQFSDLTFDTLDGHTATGTMMTMVSNRISYCFDFRGPSMSIDTACSSSLVAVHLACESLRRGETELALAGGTLLHMTPQYTIAESKGGFLSPEGRSRTFDADANGYVRAEGVGVVVLKRLADAVRDGDPVYAVVIGSGVNQDGRSNGITVPNPDAQVELIEQVCAEAGISPGDLQYVEAHGTSTPVGDPIEANALARALAVGRRPADACYIGSVKANIGHTESAAGIAGLIKTALSLQHRQIPPHINLEHINPEIDLEAAPYTIPTTLTPWPDHRGPARAGVNAFGFGGTNAHVLLEEAPPRRRVEPAAAPVGHQVLPLSAREPAALPLIAAAVRDELLAGADPVDVGYTLAHRRQHLESRLSVVYSTPESLVERLTQAADGEQHPHLVADQVRDERQRRLVWVFTGMGPQWWAMGRGLYRGDPVYRAAVDACDAEIRAQAGWSLVEHLNAAESDSQMAQTWLAQPANFAMQAGLAAVWRARGVTPTAIVGHSTGEVAAFYEAGVYTLADAVRVVLTRSRLQQKLVGTGTMLAAALTEPDAARRIGRFAGAVSIAAVNSATALTLAGDRSALTELAAELESEQVFAKFLAVQVPYHSAVMEQIKDELLRDLADLRPRPATVPVYLTAREGVAEGPELDADYWWHNVRDSVLFKAAVDRLVGDGYSVFLEIGPHPVLAHAISEGLAARGVDGRTLASVRRGEDEVAQVAATLAGLHSAGLRVDWKTLYPNGNQIPLPPYPFRRDRYWMEPRSVAQVRLGRLDHPLLGRRTGSAEPTWESRLDVEQLPYLEDHRIQGRVLFPAAGYLEMAAQAVRSLSGTPGTGDSAGIPGPVGATIADVELRKALFLSDTAASPVQLTVSAESAGFTISSVSADGADRTVHACGTLRAGQRRRLNPVLDAAAIRDRTSLRLDRDECYAALAERGYSYGPAFQAIQEAWVGADEALVRIDASAVPAVDTAGYHAHPVLLDACFQALLTPILADGSDIGSGIRLPLSIAEVRLEPLGDRPLLVHATVTRRTEDELVGDIAVYTDRGASLGRVSGFRAANLDSAPTSVGLGTIDSWLSEVSWQESPLVDGAAEPASAGTVPVPPSTAPLTGDWLLFADTAGVAEHLALSITAAGGRCHQVLAGSGYLPGETVSTVTPGSAPDLRRLFTELADRGRPVQHVVHLWNLDQPALDDVDPAAVADAASAGSYSLVTLAQLLTADRLTGTLTVVTRGTQAIPGGGPVDPLGAPAWGVGRVLRHQELGSHPGVLIDLDPLTGHGAGTRADARAVLDELTTLLAPDQPAAGAVHREDEVAYRGGRRFVSRLRPADTLSRPLPLRLRADGSYLVTGAFGALGRLVCRTLVARGARRLLLVGRTPVPERSRWPELDPAGAAGRTVRFLTELEHAGAQPIPVTVDVTDEDAVRSWLDAFRRDGQPPIRGVFHLAGQVDDVLVPEMSRDRFDTAYRPKVAGALALHRQLAAEPVEHFVLFASVASLLTTAGQTNYAAGNAFLDALAHHRRERGLPALAIDWGPWATGMIEQLGLVDHYRNSRGMSSLAPDAGMAVLERVLGQDRAQLVVATVVDWPVFLSWYPAPPALVSELAAAARSATVSADGSFLDSFRGADPATRRELVAERFTALVAGVLRLATDQVDVAASLNQLGLDSLLAMELRARTTTELGVALPVVALLSSAPVSELIGQLHAGLAELADDAETDPAAAVEVYTDQDAFPLSQNQKALWFLKHLHPDGFAYNIGGAVEMRVDLDPDLMVQALRVLGRRHPLLRANYALRDGRAVQLISAEPREDIAVLDVSDWSQDEIYRRVVAEYRRPYDLEHDALVRFRLFRRADDRWVIMKAAHHIVSDAISTFTFIEELLSVYEGLRSGSPVELPPVTATYLDFVNWQNRFLAGRDARRMLDYWRSHLPAEIPVLDLPLDKPRPAVQTHNGASEFFVLDAELSGRIQALARDTNTTVFMVLLAAYYLLLHRHAGQDDVIVGSPVTGRTQEEFAGVYGYFVNPLPLHVSLAGEPTVADLLDRVRTAVLGGLDNQEYPFVLLVEELGLARDPSRSAVFQAMFVLLSHKVATEKYGYRLEYIELPEEEGQFDLALSAYEDESDGRFHCVFKYNTDLFLADTVRRLAEHLTTLLDSVTRSAADAPVSALAMLSPGERTEILDDWSGRDCEIATATTVVDLIRAAAGTTPDAIAVSLPAADAPTVRLSYAELDCWSDLVAANLRAAGIGPGTVVAVCLDKSPELVTCLLAALKSGAAYLPLDPGHPTARLADMVRQAGAALVVAEHGQRDRFDGTVVTIDDLHRPMSVDARFALPAPLIDPDAPAYVMFTSGSAGRPKAVEVSHRNLAAAVAGWRSEYRLDGPVRRHLQLANVGFDVFTGDLVRALCTGGTLVLVTRDVLLDTALLYRTMVEERVDTGEFVPAVIRGLIGYCERTGRRLDFLRLIVVGSDTWKVEEYRLLRELAGPATRVVNSYGLTEATVDSSYYEGDTDGLEPTAMVPIGRPFPGSELYILDAARRPVPAGVPGELWIGGTGVTRGYLGDAEQTAQRFVRLAVDPDGPERLLYRTGDLARWGRSGTVDLLGRVDSQVKVRGHRVEVGEIEAQLTGRADVDQAVVTVRADATDQGDGRLCAYLVPAAGAAVDPRDVRVDLSQRLPTYMIPTAFVVLDALPLTANGKVDVNALPAPPEEASDEPYQEPVTLFEVRMAAHWAELLHRDRLGLRDDFFALGGSSITLIELIYRLQDEFNVAVAVSDLFAVTTLHGMAATLQQVVLGHSAGAQPYLRFNVGAGERVFCFPPAGGHGLVYRQFAGHLADHELVAFNYLTGDDKVDRYCDVVEAVQTEGPCLLLGYSLGGNLAFEVAKELERRGRSVPHVVILDSFRITETFDLEGEYLAAFEHELAQHLHRHTGSDVLADETVKQARDYLRFFSRQPNTGTVAAPVTVISDAAKLGLYAPGEIGAWHGSSTTRSRVVGGSGAHAEMLDAAHIAHNAGLARTVLVGGESRAA